MAKDQEDEFLDAQDDLEDETTDGELTDGDDFDDDGEPGASATADEDGAEASTPGAVARLEWMLEELLESPGEHQTEIAWRHFPQMLFYRLDVALEEDIARDDVRKSIERLREYGEGLAELIDWGAILKGTDTTFRVGQARPPGPTTRTQEFRVLPRARRTTGQ